MEIDFNSQVAGISATRRTKRNNFNTKMSPSRAATRAGNCGSGQQSALKGKPPMRQSGRRRTGTGLPAGAGRSPSRYAEPHARICSEGIGKRHLPGKSRPAGTRLIRSASNAADECTGTLRHGAAIREAARQTAGGDTAIGTVKTAPIPVLRGIGAVFQGAESGEHTILYI